MDEVDQLYIDTLDAVQEYIELQKQLSEFMRTGFLNLSSARYTMGSERVSPLQFPTTFTSTVRIITGTDNELEIQQINQEQSKNTHSTDTSSPLITDTLNQEDDIISQLATKYGCEIDPPSTSSSTLHKTTLSSSSSSINRKSDPLSWFGTLVAPSLRQSQHDFNQSLSLLIQLVNLRQHILQNIDTIQSQRK